MTDDLPPGLRRLLDSAPDPAVPPVDLSTVYAAAAEARERTARRWKRTAAAVAALAAAVLLTVGLTRLEVRAGNGELAVRWGQPTPAPAPAPAVDPAAVARLEERLNALEGVDTRLAAVERFEARFQEIDELLGAVSTDAVGRDDARRRAVADLARQVRVLQTQLAQLRSDNQTMYTALFPNKSEGVR